MKTLLVLVLALALSSCITTRYGRKKYAPGEAVRRTDEKVGEWLARMGAPSDTSGF